MKTTVLPLSLLVVLTFSAASSARIINVQRSIQGGIDAAEAGDTVLVQPGVYRESLQINTPITLCSRRLLENNRNDEDRRWIDSTVIEAVDSNRVISIRSEQSHVRICGFTIRGGYTPESGGGIVGALSNASLDELTITGCRASQYGGGIYWVGDCDSLMIRNCIITDNSAGEGGGICLSVRPNATISDCIIRDNRASNEGALFSHAANVTMHNVLITGNRSGDWGGVMRLTSCTEGSARVNLEHVTVVSNRLLNEETEDNMVFILANSPDTRMEATVSNCILWGGDYPMIKLMGYLGRCAIDYSDLSRGREGIRNESENIEALIGDNLLDSDPLFVNPDNGDYHLTENSPCIDAGDPDSEPDPDWTRADMGAFYFSQNAPPQVAVWIDDFSVDEDCGTVVIADLDTIFSDPDGDTLQYAFGGVNGLGMALDEENVLSITPDPNFFNDSMLVGINAADSRWMAFYNFYISVNPVNDLPGRFNLLSPADGYWSGAHDSIRFEWTASSDPDNEPVNYLLRMDVKFGHAVDSVSYDADSLTFRQFPEPNDTIPWPRGGHLGYEVEWWVVAISMEDSVRSDSTRVIMVYPDDVKDGQHNEPSSFNLHSLSPNPFNSSTTIRFSQSAESAQSAVRLAIYGLSGRLVDQVDLGRLEAGEHSIVWNAEGLPGGVYLVRLESGGEVKTTKAILLR